MGPAARARGAVPALFSHAYRIAKLRDASELFLEEFFAPKQKASATESLLQSMSAAYRRAQEAYGQQLTQTILYTGAAMAPTLNKAFEADPAAAEKLVVRLLRKPSAGSVLVGDVVAFYSPLAPADEQHVMVRRVAAVEGQEMVSSSGETSFVIPRDHCWVLADNASLKPPDVIDSRAFGHIPFRSIIGRVIYAAASRGDHGPVNNSPDSASADEPVVEAEVQLDSLFPEQPDGEKPPE